MKDKDKLQESRELTRSLRVGNLVCCKNEIVTINDIGHAWHTHIINWDHGDYVSPKTRVKHYSPIALTEEWLLKFGYIDMVDFYDDVDKSYSLENKWYVIFVGGVYKFGLEYQDFCTELKSVHQLQNVFFALYGKELKTNR
jgi:hypothetical protein